MARAPTPQEEEIAGASAASAGRLVGERVQHVNRIKGLLFAQGVFGTSRCARVGVSAGGPAEGDGRPLPCTSRHRSCASWIGSRSCWSS